MKQYENFKVLDISNLTKPTVYFFLKETNISERFIKNLRKTQNSIKINGKAGTLRSQLHNGDILEIAKNFDFSTSTPVSEGNLDILYEDDDFLIVNKPHNLACIPTRSHINDNLGGRVVAYMQKTTPNFVLRIINRLDKETAGIVIIAKNLFAYNRIKDLKKEYYALCEGEFKQTRFTINAPILTISNNGINEMKRIISPQGKPSITHVQVIKKSNFPALTLVKLTLETGRTHQIRVHLSHNNNPLYGDTLYGTSTLENHTFLILKKISFIHFRTGKHIVIEAPYPNDWLKYIN
ncbi:MAG: RluA family pseudouridine synthase [Candidatus Caccovivens sp.]